MLTVELLEQALAALRQLGIKTRLEWLDGQGGGECEFAGQKWLFLDLAHTPGEQLERALDCLTAQPQIHALRLAPDLDRVLNRRKCA